MSTLRSTSPRQHVRHWIIGIILLPIIASLLITNAASATQSGDADVPTPQSGESQPFVGPIEGGNASSRDIGNATGGWGPPTTGNGFEWRQNINGIHTHWLGAYDTTGSGKLEWCTNLDSLAPQGAGAIVTNPNPSPIPGTAARHQLTSAQMGYLLKKYQGNYASHRGALAALVHLNFEQGNGRNYAGNLYSDLMSKGGDLLQKFNEFADEAKASAAVAVIPGKPTVAPNKMTAVLKDFGMKSQTGAWVPNVPFKVTLTGPAVFANGSKTMEGTTSGNKELSVRSTGNGTVKTTWKFFPNWSSLQIKERFGSQTTLTMQTADPDWQNGQSSDFDLILDFQPKVSSKAGAQFVNAGEDFVDAITVEADKSYVNPNWPNVSGSPIAVKAVTTVYYLGIQKPTQSTSIPANAVKIGEATSTHNGPGTKEIRVKTGGRGGYFVAKTVIKKADQGSNAIFVHGDATYDFGLSNETTVGQLNPTITTQASDKIIDVGGQTHDSVTIRLPSGTTWPTGLKVIAKGTLYGPFNTPVKQSTNPPPGAPVAKTAQLVFTSDGETLRVPWSSNTPGFYTWVWEIRKADQMNPDLLGKDFVDDFGIAAETTLVQMEAKVTTKASDKLALPGAATSDAVTVALIEPAIWPASTTIKATGTLYGPFDMPQPQAKTPPNDAPIAGKSALIFTRDKQTLNAEWTPPKAGFYTWVWEIDRGLQQFPDLFAKSFRDDFMIHAETTSTRIPTLDHYSLAREYNVEPEGLAFDTITIGGYMESHTDWAGDGYWLPDNLRAHVRVYDAGVNPDWSSKKVPPGTPIHWETTVEAVNGVFEIGYDNKNPITGFTPGHHYVFHYEFDGDDRVAPFSSNFNDIRERFYVPGPTPLPPSTLTQATEEAMVGEPIEDTILVVGDVPDGAYLIVQAFGPQPENMEPSCETPFFKSKEIAVPGPGRYTSGQTSVDTSGFVYWVETLHAKDGSVLSKGKCGIPSETTKIYEPELKTTASEVSVMDNGKELISTITDQVCYSNVIANRPYTISGTLMNNVTGKPITNKKGKEVTSSVAFTPEQRTGCVPVPFTVESELIAGISTVIFEELWLGKVQLSVHANLQDEHQTTNVPEIGTEASGLDDTSLVAAKPHQTIVDQVCYKNLHIGKQYEVTGVLMDKQTGKPLTTKDGSHITTYAKFTATEANGCMSITFTFDATGLEGSETVVFEDLYFEGYKVATHADIEDEAQTIRIPSLKTTASGQNGKKSVVAGGDLMLIDKVCYENLEPGKDFVFHGTLMDKATGKALLIQGKPVTSTTTHTPTKSKACVNVTFRFDASEITTKVETVVFESVTHKENEYATHADIQDKGQTVTITPHSQPEPLARTGTGSGLIVAGYLAVLAGIGGLTALRKRRQRHQS